MAIALVDVQMYTLAEMKEKEDMLKGRIEVREGSKVSLEVSNIFWTVSLFQYIKTQVNLSNISPKYKVVIEMILPASYP